jgi:hypothetical protein
MLLTECALLLIVRYVLHAYVIESLIGQRTTGSRDRQMGAPFWVKNTAY